MLFTKKLLPFSSPSNVSYRSYTCKRSRIASDDTAVGKRLLQKDRVREQWDLYCADIAAYHRDWRKPQICKPRGLREVGIFWLLSFSLLSVRFSVLNSAEVSRGGSAVVPPAAATDTRLSWPVSDLMEKKRKLTYRAASMNFLGAIVITPIALYLEFHYALLWYLFT